MVRPSSLTLSPLQITTRFAPSPTGLMHIGNAFSALTCQQWAVQHQARFLLRIEDIDFTRCHTKYTTAIIKDLRWMGINWCGDIYHQSEHLLLYKTALNKLREMEVIYPCFCTRKQIQQEISRMGIAPHTVNTGNHYSGTCRHMTIEQQRERMLQQHYAWRLNIEAAFKFIGKPLSWKDDKGIRHAVTSIAHGDMVIGRKDIGISYHLAVVVDDAAQGVTHIIRGEDLRPFVDLHRLLQSLLDLPEPVYIHHSLLRDKTNNRLAKRHGAATIRALREMSIQPEILRDILLCSTDLIWRGIPLLGKTTKLT